MNVGILSSPLVAFIIICAVVVLSSLLLSRCAFREKVHPDGEKKAYSCGEEFTGHTIKPDYSQFFPFAFFFTILHVVALVIATVPIARMETLAISIVYIVGAIVGLFILLRR